MPAVQLSVAPRYTPGSPAQVSLDTALRVEEQEREAHARALDGFYGDEVKRQAEQPHALRGISIEMMHTYSRWHIADRLTDERFEEKRFADVMIGTEFWPYTGHATRDLAKRPNLRRGKCEVLNGETNEVEFYTADVRQWKQYAVLVRVS